LGALGNRKPVHASQYREACLIGQA
jgi:hypothetical protein